MGEATENRAAVERVVRDHAGWAFAAAKRRVGDAALAEDVTQAVFLLYWRKGMAIGQPGKLTGWLYRAVRYCSANALRLQKIRQRHEREAAMERQQDQQVASGWSEIEGELEGAMDRLSEKDRQAVVLRFYRGLSLREVGEALGLAEDAARMRVERAVGKLREMLAAKGVEAQSLGLSGLILAHAAEGGPAGLVERVTASITQEIGSSTAGGIAQGAERAMHMAKLTVAVPVAVVVATGIWASAAGRPRTPPATMPAPVVTGKPSTQSATVDVPVATDLPVIHRYLATLGQVSTRHVQTRTTHQLTDSGSETPVFLWKAADILCDGDKVRISTQESVANSDPERLPLDRALAVDTIWDGKAAYSYQKGLKTPKVDVTTGAGVQVWGDDPVAAMIRVDPAEAVFTGVFPGEITPIHKLLRNAADQTSQSTQLDDLACDQVEAKGAGGVYRIWFDARTHGIVRAEIRKAGSDRYYDGPLSQPVTGAVDSEGSPTRFMGKIPLEPRSPRVEFTFVLENVRCEVRNGVAIPVEGEGVETTRYGNGRVRTITSHYQRDTVDLSPSVAENAFVPKVPNGTRVLWQLGEHTTDYVWENGKIVPDARQGHRQRERKR